MTLFRKLALFTLAAAVVPLVAVGFHALSRAERALAARIAGEQQAVARGAAEAIAGDLARVDRELRGVTDAWRPERLGEGELQGFLWLVARTGFADRAAVLDASGAARAVIGADGAPLEAGAEAFLAAIRAAAPAARASGGVVLAVYDEPEGGPALAAVRAGAAGDGGAWTVAARLGLDLARRRLDGAAGAAGAAYLLDARGGTLAASGGATALEAADRDAVRRLRAGGGAERIDGPAGAVLAAFAPVPSGAGWGVLMRLPARDAYADVRALRRTVLGGSLAVLVALLAAGGAFARHVTGGLRRLEDAARRLGAGDLSVRVAGGGADEVGRVAATFNGMAAELEAARARLERWNVELKDEVERRTRELELAQARLVEAQKLAALAQLGAGVAHEINNPLTGILGHAQLLLEEKGPADPDREPLARIEGLARRCREVTQALLRFGQQRAAGRAGDAGFDDVDFDRVTRDALAVIEDGIRDAGIALDVALVKPAPHVRGDAAALAQVVLHLLTNARTACLDRPGARVLVATRRAADVVELVVQDGGKGIAPEHLPRIFEPFFTTKDLWTNVGLGLSVSYRIVAEHGGRIAVESRPGEGSTFTVTLPAAAARSGAA